MLRKLITILFCALIASPLFADKIRLNVGLWPGDLDPELEPRLFQDDLFDTTNPGRYNLDWDNKNTNTVYPLGVQYMKEGLGPGTLILGGNYIRYTPNYKDTALGLPNGIRANSISLITFENFKVSDWELEAGYQLALLDKKLLVTPKAGGRWHTTEYNYNELTIGSNLILRSLDSPFHADAKGAFIGAGVQFYVTPTISVFGDYIRTSPVFGNVTGSMKNNQLIFGAAGAGNINNGILYYDSARSGYQINLTRWTLGVEFDVTPELHLQTGVRQETAQTRYPGYYNLPLQYSSLGGLSFNGVVAELITDKIFWEANQTQTKGLIFFGASYDINL